MGAGGFHFGTSLPLSHFEPMHDEVGHVEEEGGEGDGEPGGAVRAVWDPHLPSSACLVSPCSAAS